MQTLRKTLFCKRCLQPSHWCDGCPQRINQVITVFTQLFPVSRPPSLLWPSSSSLQQNRQMSRLLPRQAVSRAPCASRWRPQGPGSDTVCPRRGYSLNSPSASGQKAPCELHRTEVSALLKVRDHWINWRQTPFPLANKELLVFGKGLTGPERRQAGFKTNAQPASAGSQLRSGVEQGGHQVSQPRGGWSPKTVTSQEGLLPHRQDDSLLKGFTNTGLNTVSFKCIWDLT